MTYRMTSEEYRALVARRDGTTVHTPPYATSTAAVKPVRRDRALGRLEAGTMNSTETAYAEHLELRRRAGEIVAFDFEAIKLRLAKRTFYEPDFLVTMADGSIEIHEVKGGPIEDDSAVKIKVAAKQFPCFKFIIARRLRSGNRRVAAAWTLKDVNDGL